MTLLAERTRPVSSSQTQLLPVLPPLVELLPDAGLRRGTTVVITATAAAATAADVSMAIALSTGASRVGSWCALVGVDDLGAVAAHELGIDLDRLAVVPGPGAAWADVVNKLIGGIDLVVVQPPFSPRPAMARRLVARTRERRSVLVVIPGRSGWPDRPDIHLRIGDVHWEGTDAGTSTGHLSGCRVTVTATGRRSATRSRRRILWLPSPTGTLDIEKPSMSDSASATMQS